MATAPASLWQRLSALKRWRAGWLRTVRRLPFFWLIIASTFAMLAIFADRFAPFPATMLLVEEQFTPPFWAEGGDSYTPLGTDQLGRDILSRIIVGARTSMIVALSVTGLTTTVAIVLGSISGYYRGIFDAVLMRIVDGVIAFPGLIIALLFIVLLGPGLLNLILAISSGGWAGTTRVIRGATLAMRERDFVLEAKSVGDTDARIIRVHILPNIAHTILVLATLGMGSIILTEASLTFLGAGLPPDNPSWGIMVSEGRPYVATHWWVPALPGFAIFLLVLSFNRIGDWMRDKFDPTLRGRY